MNDTFKSLDRTYNQRDIRERAGSRGTIELTENDGERKGRGMGLRGGEGEESKHSSRALS
jgi:hypothetical protein